jgi:hypothetical protein
LNPATKARLYDKFGVESTHELLHNTGIAAGNIDNLAEAEARGLLGAKSVDDARNRILAARQKGISSTQQGSLRANSINSDANLNPRIAPSVPAKTKYELAHEVAQRNAALPVDQGGSGTHTMKYPTQRIHL